MKEPIATAVADLNNHARQSHVLVDGKMIPNKDKKPISTTNTAIRATNTMSGIAKNLKK